MGQLAAGYRDGSDVPKDLDLATQWFERAADFTVEAMYQSYLMYSQETGEDQNFRMAVSTVSSCHQLGFYQKLVVKLTFPRITGSL